MEQHGRVGVALKWAATLMGWALTAWAVALLTGLVVFGLCRAVVWLRHGGGGSAARGGGPAGYLAMTRRVAREVAGQRRAVRTRKRKLSRRA